MLLLFSSSFSCSEKREKVGGVKLLQPPGKKQETGLISAELFPKKWPQQEGAGTLWGEGSFELSSSDYCVYCDEHKAPDEQREGGTEGLRGWSRWCQLFLCFNKPQFVCCVESATGDKRKSIRGILVNHHCQLPVWFPAFTLLVI